jgi:hypothetical protein
MLLLDFLLCVFPPPLSQFDTFVDNLQDAAALQDKSTEESIEALSESIIMSSASGGSKWPFVLVPFYDMQAAHTLTVSGAEAVMVSPVVTSKDKSEWEEYSIVLGDHITNNSTGESNIPSKIHRMEEVNKTLEPTTEVGEGPYIPVWQVSPLPSDTSIIKFDMLAIHKLNNLFCAMKDARETVISPILELPELQTTYEPEKMSVVFSPIFDTLKPSNTSEISAAMALIISWENYLSFIKRHRPLDNADYVIHNTCGESFTFQIVDGQLTDFEPGDIHETLYENMVGEVHLFSFMKPHYNSSEGHQACGYLLFIYPTQDMRDDFKSDTSTVTVGVISASFVVVLAIFLAQDRYMEEKNKQIVKSVEKSNAIIASLFPSNVRDRLFGGGGGRNDESSAGSRGSRSRRSFGFRLRTYLTEGENGTENAADSNPIADLFPDCTVLFADIVGFTAWSSMREPSQVFTLLETLYGAFDELANELGVFKVETIGDCYVAVTGLPGEYMLLSF